MGGSEKGRPGKVMEVPLEGQPFAQGEDRAHQRTFTFTMRKRSLITGVKTTSSENVSGTLGVTSKKTCVRVRPCNVLKRGVCVTSEKDVRGERPK